MLNPIFKKHYWKQYLVYGSIAAILYSVCAYFYIRNVNFKDTWWIYVGNASFMLAIFLYCLKLTMTKNVSRSAMNTLTAGNITTATGVVIACIISLVLVNIFDAKVLGSKHASTLAGPPTMLHSKGEGLFMLFVNAIFCNFLAGSFISLLTAYSVKRNQTKDRPAALE